MLDVSGYRILDLRFWIDDYFAPGRHYQIPKIYFLKSIVTACRQHFVDLFA